MQTGNMAYSLSDRGAVLENNIWDDRCISHVTLVKDISKIIMNKAQDLYVNNFEWKQLEEN